MDPFTFDTFEPHAQSQPSKGLGFATPILDAPRSNFIDELKGYGHSGSRHENIL